MSSKLKVADKFPEALKLNDGRFAETAAYIQRRYGVKYMRQSVHERAHRKFAYELRVIHSIALNEAQTRLGALVADEAATSSLRARVAMNLLTELTKYRKYAL